jgi:hypothetical protein
MVQRCRVKKHKYRNYSGRGIKVCEAWQTFDGFRNWALSSGYVHGLTIERDDSWKDYCPENCRWITLLENSRNSGYGQRFQRLDFPSRPTSFPPNLSVEFFGGA